MSKRNGQARHGRGAGAEGGESAAGRGGRFDLYQTVTDRIVGLLESGVAPWRSPVVGSEVGRPVSLTTGRPYRGVNVFLLAMSAAGNGHRSRYWLTYRQAQERGGQVRRGERSTLAVFWKLWETEDRKTGEATKVPVLRYFNLFNADQCDGVEVPGGPTPAERSHEPIAACEAIAGGFAGGPAVESGGDVPAYVPARDAVVMPEAGRFVSGESYYAALFHELAHATGSPSRLSRWADVETFPRWGSDGYRREELVAEVAAAFLCGEAGIGPATIEDSAAYLSGWVKALRGDKRLIVTVAAAAQKAADHILGRTFEIEATDSDTAGQPSPELARRTPAERPARRRAA